jgi:hypothetical protein
MVGTLNKIKRSLRDMMFKNGPGLQITNKATTPIWVSVLIGNNIHTFEEENGSDKILPGEKLTMEISDLNKDMKFAIYTEDPEMVTFENSTYSPTPDYLFYTSKEAQGKTKYLTWNPEKHKITKKFLYPQTGRLNGLMKVSRSNYNLSNNLKSFHLHLKEQK